MNEPETFETGLETTGSVAEEERRAELFENFGQLLASLGDIPPHRVRLRPHFGTATEQDVLDVADHFDRNCELVDGILVEQDMGFAEGLLAGAILAALREFVRARNLGIVVGADGMVQLWPGRVRIPDAAFLSWDRLPGRRVPMEPIPQVVPDLAIEVLSRSNTQAEMSLKRQDYFRSGVTLVWEVDPRVRVVHVYTGPETKTTLAECDALSGDPVLPGLSIPVSSIFAELDGQG